MPRTARYIEDQCFYHVISRSINETYIFKDDTDFKLFSKLVLRAKKKFSIKIFHYVFMNTHFHFVLQVINKEDLSKFIAWIKWKYTHWMKKKYDWKGPLWRERYKSIPIENENYLSACGIYIEYNPVRAGICKNAEAYPYNSYSKFLNKIHDPLTDDYINSSNEDPIIPMTGHKELLKTFFSKSPAIGDPEFMDEVIR